MKAEIQINNGNTVYAPAVEENIQWETERKNVPRQTNFQGIAR